MQQPISMPLGKTMARRSPAIAVFIVWLTALFAGCGGGSTSVSGQVYVDGEPLEVSPPRIVKIALRPLAVDAETETLDAKVLAGLTADVQADGKFELNEVPPGEYRLIASDFEQFPSTDRLAEHFRASPDSLVVTVPSGSKIEVRLKRDWYRQ